MKWKEDDGKETCRKDKDEKDDEIIITPNKIRAFIFDFSKETNVYY